MSNEIYKLFNQSFDSLEAFADTISEHLKCPVTIEDANHHLLAYSSHDDETDQARVSTIIGRRVPERVINRFWKDGVIPKLNHSDEPLVIPTIDEIGLRNRVAISIRKNEEVLGYIWVVDVNGTLTTEHLDLLKLAAQKARNQLLQLNLQNKKKERNEQEFLWQMITGDVVDHDSIEKELIRIGLKKGQPVAILVFSFKQMSKELYNQLTYISKTTQKMKILIHTLDENHWITLVAPKNSTTFIEETEQFIQSFREQIKERFETKVEAVGCGYPKETFPIINESYNEANAVLRLKKLFPRELETVHFYHELGAFRYIDLLKRTPELQKLTSNPALEKLAAYDQENQTNLMETLETVLDYEDRLTEAAKKLHCHINTLNYRLKRIKEITMIDIKDPVQKIGLYFDIKLFRQSI
ncbi:PucR family transcriptional regulator [Bacillus sp. Marseille-P3800]|uniref:PucR family transcriptional regulator n=1 Tax=Bacillus sp. Marseille-P3800 TaxID=2014782 RepID=UPI000C06C0EB|nr:helix-turn-helix domain-containing protein [Bacillus sp. Marseille-P3800]